MIYCICTDDITINTFDINNLYGRFTVFVRMIYWIYTDDSIYTDDFYTDDFYTDDFYTDDLKIIRTDDFGNHPYGKSSKKSSV